MKFPIEKQTLVGFGLASAVLVSINALSYWSFNRHRETLHWVAHTYKVQRHIESTLAELTESETGQRGYLLTEEEDYLKLYNEALDLINQQIEELQTLTADNPNQQRRINTLKPLVTQRLAALSQVIELRKEKGFSAALAGIKTSQGTQTMTRIRQVLRQMDDEEATLLKQRIIRHEAADRIQNFVFSTGIVFNGAVFYWLYRAISREIQRRRQAQAAVQKTNEALEITVADLKTANEQLKSEMFRRSQAQLLQHESEERYRQLVELCPDAIFIQSGGRFVFVNSAAVKLYGATSQEDLIGRRVLEFVHPDYQEIVKERIRKLREEEIPVELSELKAVRLDGTALDIEAAAALFTYENQPAAQVVVRDIRLRKQAEEELRFALEQERQLSELKSRIINVISHEYRTPLTTIQSSTELLEY